MIVSPSIASANLLRIGEEVNYVNKYYNEIHIDIEDGVVVSGISFGMKMAKAIKERAKVEISLHLEVLHPLAYLDQIAELSPDYVFVQTDHIPDALEVIHAFKGKGLNVGLAVGNRDIQRNYSDVFEATDIALVSTAMHEDMQQRYRSELGNYALKLSESGKKVWIDGGVTKDVYISLSQSSIYASVMGRGVFNDEKLAAELYRK